MPIADLWCMHCGELVGKLVAGGGGTLRVLSTDGATRPWSPSGRPRCARCSGPVYADESAYTLPQMVDPLPVDLPTHRALAM